MLRGGTALLLALLLCGAVGAGAAEMTDTRMLVPVGHTVGIKLFPVASWWSSSPKEELQPKPADSDWRRYCKVRGQQRDLHRTVSVAPAKERRRDHNLQVKRDGSSVTLSVEPEQNERGVYGIGAWIRDSMAGIGTMTYYDPATGAFGALGHGIADVDTAQLMPFSNGSILPSTVKAVKREKAALLGSCEAILI